MGGGSLIKAAALGSSDGTYVFVAAAADLRGYSSVSGIVVHQLYGHARDILCIARHPSDCSQVLTGSEDGTIRLWDLPSGKQLRRFDLGQPVCSIGIPGKGTHAFCMVQATNGGGKGLVMHLDTGKISILSDANFRSPVPFTVSAAGWMVAAFQGQSVLLWSAASPSAAPLRVSIPKQITCVALDQEGDRLATGDVTGRINIIYGVREALAARQGAAAHARGPHRLRTTLHWHAHRVGALCFGRDGTFLLSGGQEAVLVKWQLGSGGKDFLPRLGAPVISIDVSPADAANIVVGQADNTIRLINWAAKQALTSIHGLHNAPELPLGLRRTAALVPGSGELVVPAAGGLLQFYDPVADAHVANLKVRLRNAVSITDPQLMQPRGKGETFFQPAVSLLAFSGDGSKLATVEVQAAVTGEPHTTAATLSFYERVPVQQSGEGAPFRLLAQVLGPHRSRITDLAFSPSEDMAVTTSEDGEFKVWVAGFEPTRRGQGTEGMGLGPSQWRCRSAGEYRGVPLTAATFSDDGSLLAIGAGDLVTLWNPWENVCLQILHPPLDVSKASPLHRLAFVPATPFLVGCTQGAAPCLVIWNVLEARVWWSSSIPVSELAVHPERGCFAVALTTNVPHNDQAGQRSAPPMQAFAGAARAHTPASTSARQGSRVMLFDARSPTPLAGWFLPCSVISSLHFALPGTPLAAMEADSQAPSLLVLTLDRNFIVLPNSAMRGPLQGIHQGRKQPQQMEIPYKDFVGLRTGAVAVEDHSASVLAEPGLRIMETAKPGGRYFWLTPTHGLLDAPSHVLPPLAMLGPSLLDQLVD